MICWENMISVIIPVYNVENNLYYCLNSVLRQSYGNFEIICIDDASIDSSLDILEYFAEKDSRIKILKNDLNRGYGFSRNQGLNIAQGKYVFFLDANDWIDENAFEILIKTSEENNLDILMLNNILYLDESKEFGVEEHYSEIMLTSGNAAIFNYKDLNKHSFFNTFTKIENKFYLKSFLDNYQIRFLDENLICGDIFFFFNVFINARRVSVIDDYLYMCRNLKLIEGVNDESLFDFIDISYFILKLFLEKPLTYQNCKKEVLSYIFVDILDNNYEKINDNFKDSFFKQVQNVYRNFIKFYDLYDDILESIDKNILNKFKFYDLFNNLPRLSIIVPVYNTEQDLPRVLDSIVNQSIGLENLEIIVVNDASTDKSGEIIDHYCLKYDHIISIHLTENSGSPSKPRNIGIKNATSDYIIFQDSDDGFILDACETLFDVIVEENVDLVTGMINTNFSKDNFEITYSPWDLVLNQYEEFRKRGVINILKSSDLFKFKINSIDENKFMLLDYALNSILFKKSLFIKNNIRFPEYLNGAEDSVVIFNSYINAKGIVFINKAIYNYNIHRLDSLTHNFSLKTIKSRPNAYKLMYDFAIKHAKKELFVEMMLVVKLNYWINEHLIKAPFLDSNDIFEIFKSYKILFIECINSSANLQPILMYICDCIKNDNFDGAVQKVMDERAK